MTSLGDRGGVKSILPWTYRVFAAWNFGKKKGKIRSVWRVNYNKFKLQLGRGVPTPFG